MSITSTFIFQLIVFLILVWFTMKFVWPPITAALDERAQQIADGLSAADKAKSELAAANPSVGCVIVASDRVVGRGWTQPGGRPHAEAMALAAFEPVSAANMGFALCPLLTYGAILLVDRVG